MERNKFELLSIDEAFELNKAVRGHTKIRATKLERVGPGTHRTERKKKVVSENMEKAKPYTRSRRGKMERVKGYSNRFALYDHPHAQTATAEITAALKSKNIEHIAETVGKWRHVGAEDTGSRDEIVLAFKKLGGNHRKLSEKL